MGAQNDSHESIFKPHIPSSQILPEITLKGTILAILLAAILAAANTYLGLKVGVTVTGSIPAAIVSMALLRFFKRHNILENNIVQTGASAGDVLASGALFTLPALLIVHFWQGFNYLETLTIILTGGVLGVLFSIPLRRTFIHEPGLKFPEGVAIGSVLKVSSQDGGSIKQLIQGTVLGSLFTLCQSAFRVLSDGTSVWLKTGKTIIGFGTGYDVAVIGAGYIVGIHVGLSALIGAIIGWGFGIPIFGLIYGIPENIDLEAVAMTIWSEHIRFVGVGTMLIGGIYSIFKLIKPIYYGLVSSFNALKVRKTSGHEAIQRVERDIPINFVLWGVGIITIVIAWIFIHFLSTETFGLSQEYTWFIALINTAYLIIAGFLFSAICCYLAGLVGSSSNPLSGILLAAILAISFILLPIFNFEISTVDSELLKSMIAISIIVTALIGTSAAIAQDNLQDLKAGQIVGATPWKQQLMLVVGVLSSALVIPPVLDLLFNAYGIGGVFPRENMDPNQMLAAPQSALMASIASGVYAQNLPWAAIGAGAIIATIVIMVDESIKKQGYSLPVLAVGIGIYLPISATMPLTIGGFTSYFVNRKLATIKASKQTDLGIQKGISAACGLVAGASITGIILAIPAVIFQSSDIFNLVSDHLIFVTEIIGAIAIFALCKWIYNTTTSVSTH